MHATGRRAACAALLALAASAAHAAQDSGYPARPIRFLVPFPPGGSPDIQARLIADPLRERLGKPLIIDNRAGANGVVAMEIAARAPADGYTMIIGTVGIWTVHPHLHKLSYDVLTDFAPVIHVATTPGVLAVGPTSTVTSVKELIAFGKQNPGKLNYGSAGIGGFGHVCAELFTSMTGAKMTHVPYKSSVTALSELVTNQIQVLFNAAAQTVPFIKSGRVRPIAVTSATRAAILPDLPTIAEAGVPGYENSTWTAIGVPRGTPQAIVQRLNKSIGSVLQMPDVQERFAATGGTITGGTPQEMDAYLRKELAKYGKLVKEAGIKAESAP